MKAFAAFLLAVVAIVLFERNIVRAQSQGWSADQDGSNFAAYNIAYLQENNCSPGGVMFSQDSTAIIACHPSELRWDDVSRYMTIGTHPAIGNYKLLINNSSGVNNGRVEVTNDESFGVESAAAYELTDSVDGSATTLAYWATGETVYGSEDTALTRSKATGNFWMACGSPTPSKVFQQTCDGALALLDSTPAVSAAGRCAFASIGGVWNFSCHGSAWAPFVTGGTVTTVTATPPIFITSTPTTTPNVTIQGSIVSGSTSTSAINLGTSVSNAILACSTASSTCTPTAVTVAGGLNYNTGTGTLTDGSFTCGANTFVSSSSTSGLACTQPAFSNLSGSATCAQLPALTGDITTSAGSCATVDTNKGKLYIDATDAAAHSPDYLYPKLTSFTNTISFAPIGTGDGQLTVDVAPSVYQQTKHDYAFQFSAAASVTNCGLFAGGNGVGAGCTLIEYPNNFQAGHIQLTANFGPTNTITVGTLSFQATLNGSPISGTQFSFTSVTSPGEAVISPQVTGSGAASDTYGLVFSTSGTYVGGFQTATFQVTLSP